MLDHQLELALLVVGYGAAVAAHAGLGQRPPLGGGASGTDRGRQVVHTAVGTGCAVVEKRVARLPDDLFGTESECLLGGTVHPYHGVLRIMDNDDVIDGIKNHVHELLCVYVVLFHVCHCGCIVALF